MTRSHTSRFGTPAILMLLVAITAAACGSSDGATTSTTATTAATTTSAITTTAGTATDGGEEAGAGAAGSMFVAEVWADNWFALYINGVLVGEDSVPITTERSFNAETISFEAGYPLTIAIEAKDFKETHSGLEYIGEPNQQMGDGGIIAQITDSSTGQIVAVTNSGWSLLVIHRAPLNTECERDAEPDTTCTFEIAQIPSGWAESAFDDSNWTSATEWSEGAVGPKDGYDTIAWDPTAELIWGTDLEVDNTILLRVTVGP